MENFVRVYKFVKSEVDKQRKAYVVFIRDYILLTVSVMESENKWMCCWTREKKMLMGSKVGTNF